jgi:enoyl-CoA hydratase
MHSVDVTVRGHVAEVKLSRPEARNALSQSLCRALTEEMVALEERTEIRVVLISGKGAVFCAGADLSAVSGPQALEFLAVFEEMLEAVARHPKPTIAVLHGAALGGGLQLATVCDFRVAGRSARVGIPAASLGIVVNLENVERLVRLAGPARAKEILMAGRMFSGEEAKASGLLTSAVEDGEEAESARLLAERMAALAPLAVQGVKQAIDGVTRGPGDLRHMAPQAASEIDRLVEAAYGSEDLQEGLRAAAERRAPRFSGR